MEHGGSKTVKFIVILLVVLVLGYLLLVFLRSLMAPKTTTTTDTTTTTTDTTIAPPDPAIAALAAEKDAAANVVIQFGTKMQYVSLLAPHPYVVSAMQTYYTKYVDPELLAIWENNPTNAAGRTVSSPWPVRIDINTISKTPDGMYSVIGTVVEVTSTEVRNGGSADTYPVYMTLQNENGVWKIFSYERGNPS